MAAVAGAFVFALKMGVHVPFMPTDKDFPLLLAVVAAAVCQSLMSSPFYGIYHGLQHGYTAGLFQGLGRLTGTCASLAAAWYGASVGMVFLANVAMMTGFNALAAVGTYYFYPWAFVAGPMWERHHISTQLRTGLKNLGLQIGDVVVSSAPVLAISSRIGAAAVPQFTVPLTMLNVPLSFFFSINAALQSGYGEAFGRGDTAWVVRTIRIVLENALILIALVSTGYFLVGSDFVELWTQARLSVNTMQLSSAWLMAVTMSLLGIFRFALVGLNRHRMAAVGEISFAILALGFTVVLVGRWGIVGAGVGVLAAADLTSAWVMPSQLQKVFPDARFFPDGSFLARLVGVTCCSFAAGSVIKLLLHGFAPQVLIVAQVLGTTATFVLAASMLLPESYARVRRLLLRGIMHRFQNLIRRSTDAR